MTFNIKQNDTSPNLTATLLDEDGLPVPLISAQSARFHMRNSEGTVVIDADIIITDAVAATVLYAWQASDTATAGTYQAEVEITFLNGQIETFPNVGYLEIVITDDIA